MKLEQNDKNFLFSETKLPDVFFTEYMSQASGDYIKVYLYITFLSKYNKEVKINDLSKSLNIPFKTIQEALAYWEEKEVLILTGNKYKAKCLGYSDSFFGKDGHPALMYDVEVFAPDKFYCKINESTEKLKQVVFDKNIITKVKNFYEALNTNIGGKYPEEPKEYRYWKNAFKQYVYSELNKIY